MNLARRRVTQRLCQRPLETEAFATDGLRKKLGELLELGSGAGDLESPTQSR